MYSTNLHLTGDGTMLHSGLDCVGTAYGWETVDKDEEGNVTHVGPATQTAKDNALLWSLAPEMVELLPDLIAFAKGFGMFLKDERSERFSAEEQEVIDKGEEILAKLAHAIPLASVAADA